MKNHIKIFALSLLLVCMYSQLQAQHRLDTIRADFNNDKIIDTLIEEYDSGSSFGGTSVNIIDGKTKDVFFLTNYGCYCSFTNLIRVPENLLLEKNRLFLDVLKEKVVTQKKDTIDATLQWIMSALFNRKQVEKHPYFEFVFIPKTPWKSHKPFIPKSYHIEISGDTLQRLTSRYDEDPPVVNTSKAFLIYYTGSHLSTRSYNLATLDSLEPVAANKKYEVYKAAHSVFVKKGNKHKWLFISEAGVTGAPDKLRWESIGNVQLIDKYVIIHQNVAPDNIYNIVIVNIETQRAARLARKFKPSYNNWTDEGGMDTFEIIENQLVFSEYGVQELHKIPLQELFDSLDSYEGKE